MDDGILYLFADTNVFLQCKPLRELKWEAFGSWERIELVITRPVQAEIDSLKDGGNARRSARARLASALIHELLDTDDGRIELRVKPSVHVSLRSDLRRDESAADVLDYAERDDQLVGTTLKFLRSGPCGAVRILSNDTGPKASAKAVGLQYFGIPADWMLAPELDEAEKQVNRLRAENDRLRSQEPVVELEALAPYNGKVHAKLQRYTPISPGECDELMARLASRFPMASDFGSREPQERLLDPADLRALLGHQKERFEPASDKAISAYMTAYEKWFESCRTMLTDLQITLNKRVNWPRLTVRAKNSGTRPANDALLTLTAAGKLLLMPPRRKDDDDEGKQTGPLALPRPPNAPRGTWHRVDPFDGFGGRAVREALALQRKGLLNYDPMNTHLPHFPEPPDPNAFYFKQGMRGSPAEEISYECKQWRHAGSPEDFVVDVLCPPKSGNHSGLIKATVQAANLTEPLEMHLAVVIEVEEISCLEEARALVEGLR